MMKLFRKKIRKPKVKKLINSFKYAFSGILSSIKSERNMKIHLGFLVAVVISGIIFKISYYEWLICLILFAIVLAGEMINTSIETVVDMLMPYQDDKAKLAKDISAGAVLVLTFISAIIGLIIFIPKFLEMIGL